MHPKYGPVNKRSMEPSFLIHHLPHQHPNHSLHNTYKSPRSLPHPQVILHLCFPSEKKSQPRSMAKLLLLLLLLTTTTTTTMLAKQPYSFIQSQKPAPKHRQEKLTHLHLFWHDILSGRDPTAVPVAQAASTNTSRSYFGLVNVIDDPLTEGPAMASKLVGRAQGLYASASQEGVNLLMAMNFAFMDEKYNGSTITILGHNAVFTTMREMPVIGGSGLFRLARGYVQAKTHNLDLKTGNAVVEYNCFVFHY